MATKKSTAPTVAQAALSERPLPDRRELVERINATTLRLEQACAIVSLAASELVQADDPKWGCALCAAQEILDEVSEEVSRLHVPEQDSVAKVRS